MIKSVPSESDFLSEFGVLPSEAQPEDGYWRYDFGSDEEELRFSFNVLEGSVQTEFVSPRGTRIVVSREGAVDIYFDKGSISVDFADAGGVRTVLSVRVLPRVEVVWSSLFV